MEANRFDDLVKRVSTRRLTRGQVLRGLVASGVAAIAGAALTTDAVETAKKTKKIKVCHCHGAGGTGCTQGKVKIKKGTDQGKRKAKKLRKHLKNNVCDYRGRCQSVNPRCPGGTPSTCADNDDCSGGLACIDGTCQPCQHSRQCDRQVCLDGVCVGGETCTDTEECDEPLECLELGGEFRCLINSGCENDSGCDPGLICVLGACTGGFCDSVLDECDFGACVAELGLCLPI